MASKTTTAAIGTDGKRPVVWGLGDSEGAAAEDAARWLGDQSDPLVYRRLTAEEVASVEAGDVAGPASSALAREPLSVGEVLE